MEVAVRFVRLKELKDSTGRQQFNRIVVSRGVQSED
jgi:hypothetical protein